MKISAAIFDLDGTLLDSMPIWNTIGEQYLRNMGIEPRKDLNEKLKSMSLYQAACYYKRKYDVKLKTDEIIKGIVCLVDDYYQNKIPTKEGVPEFLEKLKQSGIKMCIATASEYHLAKAALKRCKILDYFLEIFTCTSVGYGKDKPHIYEAARMFMSTPKNETLVFEDALYAAQTAKKAGFYVVGVYDKSENKQEELKALADFYIKGFTKMEGMLL